MAWVAAAAAIAGAVSSVIQGIAGNEQAKAESKAIQRQSLIDENIARADFQVSRGKEIAQAGGTGLSLTGGSFLDIFTENALNEAKTLSDIRFQGAVDSANMKAQGKASLISGLTGGGAMAVSGIAGAKHKKRQLASDRQNATANARANRRAAAPPGRSLLGPQG